MQQGGSGAEGKAAVITTSQLSGGSRRRFFFSHVVVNLGCCTVEWRHPLGVIPRPTVLPSLGSASSGVTGRPDGSPAAIAQQLWGGREERVNDVIEVCSRRRHMSLCMFPVPAFGRMDIPNAGKARKCQPLCVSEHREAGLLITNQPSQEDTFLSLMPPLAPIPATPWVHTRVRTHLRAGHHTSVLEKLGSH